MTKLEKIIQDIDRTKTKISEMQIRLRELEKQKVETENSEILDIVKGNITKDELAKLIKAFKANSINIIQNKQEENKIENQE